MRAKTASSSPSSRAAARVKAGAREKFDRPDVFWLAGLLVAADRRLLDGAPTFSCGFATEWLALGARLVAAGVLPRRPDPGILAEAVAVARGIRRERWTRAAGADAEAE